MRSERLKDRKLILIILLMAVYAGIYAYRMFTNMPWYDELYTYYSFISRGPVYGAIHWPLPNNHVGYSALSGFLSYFGNATIALRGVSFICAVINIYLVYFLSGRLLGGKISFICTGLYGAVFLVHNMAVQGRGYTLSTTCYLLSLIMLYRICLGVNGKIEYIVYTICLFTGIYAVPSSTFWVIPVCICGGIYLLFNKQGKTLIKLIIASVIAALISLGLYLTIWLSIGSNLLSKDPSSPCFGIYQLNIIARHPVDAAKRGLDYMLASPYIQSMDSEIVRKEIFTYLGFLFEQFYSGMGKILIVFLGVTAVIGIVRFIKNRTRFMELFLAVSIILLPVMLIIQSVQPYLRVFSFFGFVVALGISMYLNIASEKLFKGDSVLGKIIVVIMTALLVAVLFTGKYMAPMADREVDIANVLEEMENSGTPVDSLTSIYYTDDYQKYVIKYLYDKEIEELPMGECDYVLISDTMEDKDIGFIEWPMLTCSTSFDFDLLNDRYEMITEKGPYRVYRKKADE